MSTELAVRVRGLRKQYRTVTAVGGIDLDIQCGEVFAILGPNGAGKTTTVEILGGYRRRDAVAARLVTQARRPQREVLSHRETEVLQLVARGLTNAAIGHTLFISEATVKTHLLRAFGKLGVTDRTAAVTTAIERGELPAPGS